MIQEFKGKYTWLSNFAPCKIMLNGVAYSSVEHAYQSAKSHDQKWKHFCATEPKAGVVKRKSRNVPLVSNWEVKRLHVMFKCLLQKYNQYPYNEYLRNTGNEHIQEGNTWNDTFWGVCLKEHTGKNVLGNMIMLIRRTLWE